MSDLEFRRRVMAQFGISGDKWDGFDFGVLGTFINNSTTPIIYKTVKVAYTPFIEVVAGHSIKWNDNCANNLQYFVNGGNRYSCLDWAYYLRWFDENKNELSVNTRGQQPRTITAPAGAKYCKMNISLDEIAGAYIQDVTTGEYLWRGSDYVE